MSVWVLDQDAAKDFYTKQLGCELTNDIVLDNGMRSLGLHGVLAFGDTDYILTRSIRLSNADCRAQPHGQCHDGER